ncbi:hypothetical protein AGABI1DRAFT_105883 [Agaricus bisporus var. burnettii JB137-S8]|uniref:Ribosomal RNA-processing protein 17 n=1 Tax=Agaricus bisporus var. burnettii (strain JB137-S8 / ATCC MYA-4627 / FGSC 10392) TaxID=597362 RepID=K5XZY9_AGABU|nr:uncharacterized protein AGABI1DRAFT_105883 [Agaricus bisporus var. burnettii JB137-S8]EKM81050.1 hypothetical protein AGABI1DRAFT_105883 [Agaricus bisporus var. burnettii JB137-S8]
MDNLASLTRSHTILAAKKRSRRQQIPEIVFDDSKRRDFLTGFHKRKLAKADAARKRAQERDKQLQAEARREQRRALREKAIENATKIEGEYAAVYGSHNEEEEEWPGITPTTSKQRDEEYEDEEVLATVTVVEDFDPDTILHGPPRPTSPTSKAVPPPPIPKPAPPKKPKAQKIRYQTKGARTADRRKQLVRKNEKAERAGGKASRERSSKNTRKSRK